MYNKTNRVPDAAEGGGGGGNKKAVPAISVDTPRVAGEKETLNMNVVGTERK